MLAPIPVHVPVAHTPARKSRSKKSMAKQPERNLVRELNPLVSIGAPIVGVVVWAYSTFALKEQASMMLQIIERKAQENTALTEKRYEESKQYSDRNRERMEDKFNDIMDALDRLDGRQPAFRRPSSTRLSR